VYARRCSFLQPGKNIEGTAISGRRSVWGSCGWVGGVGFSQRTAVAIKVVEQNVMGLCVSVGEG